jgi:hypothetical protein
MRRTMTSRELNQDVSAAKRAAAGGPVVITDRGRPTHVLLSFADYERLARAVPFVGILGEPEGVADLVLELPRSDESPVPAAFD